MAYPTRHIGRRPVLWVCVIALLAVLWRVGQSREAPLKPVPDHPPTTVADRDDPGSGDASWRHVAVGAWIVAGGLTAALVGLFFRNRRVAAALRETDRRFEAIAANMDEAIWLGSADGRHLEYVSPAYETIWGHPCQRLYDNPRAWMEDVFPHDRQAVREHLDRDKQNLADPAGGIDFRIIRPDGDVRWIHARQFAIPDTAGAGRQVLGIGRDITRRKFYEATLRESEEKWRSLMENSPDHIMLMDLDGHILYANRDFMGRERSALVGKPLVRLLDAAFQPAVLACFDQVMTDGAPHACRVSCRENRDSPAFFEMRMGPVTVGGRTVAVAANSTEITDRVIQENTLLESEAFHRTLFDDAPTGLAIQDFSVVASSVQALMDSGLTDLKAYLTNHPDAVSRLAGQVRMVKVNPALVDLYRATGQQAIIGPLSPFLKDDDRTHFIDQVVAFTSGRDRYEGEARNVDFSGQTLHLIIRKVVIQRQENGLSKILTTLVDVTALKAAEKERQLLLLQLQQAQKMEAIGTLAGGVAHDFNNILSIILGNVELSLSDVTADHPVHLNLMEIEKASFRARDIVRQLLELSRRSEQILEPVHLVPVVAEAVKFLRATLPANITVHTDFNLDDDVVRADTTQIHQVMINLFTNAGHAMEQTGGDLSVRARNVTLANALAGPIHAIPAGRYVQVSVTDTGDGIPEEIRERIFDPYFTTKAVGKGTGMGLAMVHGIMQHSGGGIVLETGKGVGTTFTLYFPLADTPAQPADAAIEIPVGGCERVLFVDDEVSIADLNGRILERLGYRVTTLNDPQAALSRIETDLNGFDLLITDMTMPLMTGDRLVESVRRLQPSLPVILCTGYRARISESTLERLRIDAILDKPVALQRLAVTVRDVLDRHRRR